MICLERLMVVFKKCSEGPHNISPVVHAAALNFEIDLRTESYILVIL